MIQRFLFIASICSLLLSCASDEVHKSNSVEPQVNIEGVGDYTFVMDAGMGNWSLFFQPVASELSKVSKVCLIDRAGYNMDSVTTKARDAHSIALEMDNILTQNGISENIILVGHSMGGLHVRMYQSLFPEKVKGIVLLDSSHPKQFEFLPKEFSDIKKNQIESLDDIISYAERGWLEYDKSSIPTFGLPETLLEGYYNVTTKPAYYMTLKMETIDFDKSLEQVSKLNHLGNIPLLVIASENSMDESLTNGVENYPFSEHNKTWLELQKQLAELSTNSTFIVSPQNHYLHIKDKEMVTNEMIKFYNNISSK